MNLLKFVAGNNINLAIRKSSQILSSNKKPILNYIVEDKKNKLEVYQEYKKINQYLDSRYKIALKLSSFDFDYPLLSDLIARYSENNIKILIDAESSEDHQKYMEISNCLIEDFNQTEVNIYKTYQMYRKDSYQNLLQDIEYFKNQNIHLGTKLVRGAYHNTEKYLGQLYSTKTETDVNYNQAILLNYDQKIPTILATHNNESINLGILLNKYAVSQEKNYQFSFAHLLDMNNQKYDSLKFNQTVYTYIPYGPYKEMIPYLSRRLYENLDTIKYMLK